MRCKGCYYSLENLIPPGAGGGGTGEGRGGVHRCPECGLLFDPKYAKTYIADVAAYRANLKRINWGLAFGFVLFTVLMGGLALLLPGPNGSRFMPLFMLVVPVVISVLIFGKNLRILRKLKDQ